MSTVSMIVPSKRTYFLPSAELNSPAGQRQDSQASFRAFVTAARHRKLPLGLTASPASLEAVGSKGAAGPLPPEPRHPATPGPAIPAVSWVLSVKHQAQDRPANW